jgi:hypothetical protein
MKIALCAVVAFALGTGAVAAEVEPSPTVILLSMHNLDYAKSACWHLRTIADMKYIGRVLNNASDYDPADVKSVKQQSDGIWECNSVRDPRELGRRLENNVMDQLAVNRHCAGVTAYIAGYDEYDGKFNEAATQAEQNGYWSLMVDYAPASKTYEWSLLPTKGDEMGRMVSGEGTPFQIAEQVCIVVKGQGARVR